MTRASSMILMTAVLAGCAPCRHCPYSVAQKDSLMTHTTETVTLVDTVIQWKIIEGQSSAVLHDTDTSRLSTQLASSEAWVADGKLHHTLRNRSDLTLPILIAVPMKATSTERARISDRVVTVEVEKPLGWWQKLWMRAGQIAVGILVLYIAFKMFVK